MNVSRQSARSLFPKRRAYRFRSAACRLIIAAGLDAAKERGRRPSIGTDAQG
jgi:hypothetical protein